jgi:hypothetical protein
MWRCLSIAVARVFAGILRNCINFFVYKIIALAKTVTPVGDPGGSRGRPHR